MHFYIFHYASTKAAGVPFLAINLSFLLKEGDGLHIDSINLYNSSQNKANS
jgi:hypothetical protein